MELWTWVVQFAGYLLYLAGFVAAIGLATSWVVKLVGAARKPHKDLENRVSKLEESDAHQDLCLKRDLGRFEAVDKRFGENESDSKLMLRALMQIITHELDGNHVDKLAEVRDKIHDHLIER